MSVYQQLENGELIELKKGSLSAEQFAAKQAKLLEDAGLPVSSCMQDLLKTSAIPEQILENTDGANSEI